MLQYKESERPSMAQVLEFPYFEAAKHELSHVPPEKFANFLNAHKLHRARQGLLLEIAARMPFMATSIQPSAWTRLHKRGPRWEDMKTCEQSKTLQPASDLCITLLQ